MNLIFFIRRMYRKRNNIRKISPRILVLCEGYTEKLYFWDMRATLSRQAQRDITINIHKAHKTEPKNILEEALKFKQKAESESQPYHDIWLVFDDDNRKELKSVFYKAEKNNIKIAYSSISFEYWYLIHFIKKAVRFRNADDAKRDLCTHIPGYCETTAGVFKLLEPRYKKQALPNAHWLQNQKEYSGLYSAYLSKPITNVNELCEIILNFGK